MARAFTEEEKEQIRERLLEEGLIRFKEKGLKGVSIREFTDAVSIAQGGFYTFFESKEDLLIACVNKRMQEKLEGYRKISLEQQVEEMKDPIAFLTERFYATGMHLKDNLVFNNLVSDSVNVLLGNTKNLEENNIRVIREFLIWIIDWWQEHGLTVTVDTEGLRAFMKAGAILFMNEEIIGKERFPEIFHSFVEDNTRRYFQVTGTFEDKM